MKSNSSSSARSPAGIARVVNPRAVPCRATCHQWFCIGANASCVLPTIWVHRCSVSMVSRHVPGGSSGHASTTLGLAMRLDHPQPLVDAADDLRADVCGHGVFQLVGLLDGEADARTERAERLAHR